MPMASGRRVLMGRVLGAHGIKGAVRIMSYAAVPEGIARYGPLEDESGVRRFSLRIVGKARGNVLVEVDGIGDRNAAEALRGINLYLQRSALPAPAEGEFYWDDLVGLRAELVDGTKLGEVVAVHDYGGGASLEVKREVGAPVMVPFTNRVVPVVDVQAGKLVIDPPAGLFETPDPEPRNRERRE